MDSLDYQVLTKTLDKLEFDNNRLNDLVIPTKLLTIYLDIKEKMFSRYCL